MFCPIMIDVSNKKILIVGGGKVAYRKAKTFLKYNGNISILSPNFIKEFDQLIKDYKGQINLIEGHYNKKYINDCLIVIAATSKRKTNKRIAIDCNEVNTLCNIVDSKEESSFISSGIVNNGGITVSISTNGKFPYLSKKIREDIGCRYDKFDYEYMDLLMKLRKIVLVRCKDKRSEIFSYAL